ncbi:tetratricopeptide repeat protein [Lactococcus cremoris]|uniref:tetratricopeptide repeat protein n=1 Tax=Lactococcus lactis subsp. cremoris TaxID=1359 RepID=UPI0024A759EE|nr:tetratricopeptide repeat protein [Lactococcus cremoris]
MNINFYKELKLSIDDSSVKICKELVKQEKLWYSRETTKPEEARKYLFYIDEAKKVFKSEESKKRYDQELIDLNNQSDLSKNAHDNQSDLSKNAHDNQFNTWYKKAWIFLENEQFDLAESAIDKAMGVWPKDSDDYLSLSGASYIYYSINQYSLALKYINDSIVLNSDYAWNYRYKYCYLKKLNQAENNELYNLLDSYVKKSEESGNKKSIIDAYEFTADENFTYFKNIQKAKFYSEKSIEIDPNNVKANKIIESIVNNGSIRTKNSLIDIPSDPYNNKWYQLAQKKLIRIPLWFFTCFPIAKFSGLAAIIYTIIIIFGPNMWARHQIKKINGTKQIAVDETTTKRTEHKVISSVSPRKEKMINIMDKHHLIISDAIAVFGVFITLLGVYFFHFFSLNVPALGHQSSTLAGSIKFIKQLIIKAESLGVNPPPSAEVSSMIHQLQFFIAAMTILPIIVLVCTFINKIVSKIIASMSSLLVTSLYFIFHAKIQYTLVGTEKSKDVLNSIYGLAGSIIIVGLLIMIGSSCYSLYQFCKKRKEKK